VIALCPDCHQIRHWGRSLADGRREETLRHLVEINRWTLNQAEHATAESMAQWEERSRHEWKSDYSWVTRTHGFVPGEAGEARAETANRELVAAARQRAEEADQFLVDAMLEAPPRQRPQPARIPNRSIFGMLKSLFR
jgi:hypothetical protein